ncbi:MAG TPA: magnesium transporter [Bacilli bacterium]|nr:magnesium transporter [Bacilli bacterium]
MQELKKQEQILDLIKHESNIFKLANSLKQFHPYDIAEAFLDLTPEERQKVYRALSHEDLADIFEYLDEVDGAIFLKEMDISRGTSVLSEMETDDATDIINELEEDASSYLEKLELEDKKTLDYLRTYEEETAGSIMTTNFLEVDANWDVKEAMKFLIAEADEAETVDPLFVSTDNKLVGLLDLKKLIIARSPKKISEIMNEDFSFVNATDSIGEASNKIRNYDIYALPVLEGQRLVGIITMDDALDVIQDQVNVDLEKLASIGEAKDGKATLYKTLATRIPWLILLLVLSSLIINVLGTFEDVIKQVTVLIFFQTLILDMAGNVGTQSLAVTIRSLSRRELDTKKKIRSYFLKEFKVSIINSFLLGIMAFIVSFIFLKLSNNPGVNVPIISLIVSLSIVVSLSLSGMFGIGVPIIFSKMKIDPAAASGPFITTLNDLISVVIYFNLAILFLGLYR